MRTTEEQTVIDLAKATERLYKNSDFQKVILESYINTQVISLGVDFDATESELDALKAITHLVRYLETRQSEGIIMLQSNKSN